MEAELEAVRAKAAALEATSQETLWLNDLDNFANAWDDYTAWRNSTYESSSVVVPQKKKAIRKTKVKA